jgi:hypothetical protein
MVFRISRSAVQQGHEPSAAMMERLRKQAWIERGKSGLRLTEAGQPALRGTKMKHIAWMAVGMVLAGPAAAQDAYLCISDAAAGMAFDKDRGSWVATTFKAGERYIFRKAEEPKLGGRWVLFQFGKTSLECPMDETPDVGAGSIVLFCQNSVNQFEFSKQSLRFEYHYVGGYVFSPQSERDEDRDTPNIQIGKCSPL